MGGVGGAGGAHVAGDGVHVDPEDGGGAAAQTGGEAGGRRPSIEESLPRLLPQC